MTAQVSDIVSFLGEGFSLCAFSNGEPFNPKEYNYNTVSSSTACYRGYQVEYLVTDKLLVKSVTLNHQDLKAESSRLKKPHDLNCISPLKSKQNFIGAWKFNDVNLILEYTGNILIGRKFIQGLYRHMGYHPYWKYEVVFELGFHKGNLCSSVDISQDVEKFRSNFDPKSELASENWISESFERKYSRKN